jgi:hypothetical protein
MRVKIVVSKIKEADAKAKGFFTILPAKKYSNISTLYKKAETSIDFIRKYVHLCALSEIISCRWRKVFWMIQRNFRFSNFLIFFLSMKTAFVLLLRLVEILHFYPKTKYFKNFTNRKLQRNGEGRVIKFTLCQLINI